THAGRALVAALARGPRAILGERAPERLHLANAAALLVTVLVEAEEALSSHERLERGRVGREHADLDAVVSAHAIDELVGLRVQAPRIQAEHREAQAGRGGHVDEHHVLGAAEGEGARLPEALEAPAQDLLGRA